MHEQNEFLNQIALNIFHSMICIIYKYLQCKENPAGDYTAMNRYFTKGSWTFSDQDQGWVVSDCTAEALKVLRFDFDLGAKGTSLENGLGAKDLYYNPLQIPQWRESPMHQAAPFIVLSVLKLKTPFFSAVSTCTVPNATRNCWRKS